MIDRDAPTIPESEIPEPFPSPPRVPSETGERPTVEPPPAPAPEPYHDLELLMSRVVDKAVGRLAESMDALRTSVDAQTALLVHEMQRHSSRITAIENDADTSRQRIAALERSVGELKRARDTDPAPAPLDAE